MYLSLTEETAWLHTRGVRTCANWHMKWKEEQAQKVIMGVLFMILIKIGLHSFFLTLFNSSISYLKWESYESFERLKLKGKFPHHTLTFDYDGYTLKQNFMQIRPNVALYPRDEQHSKSLAVYWKSHSSRTAWGLPLYFLKPRFCIVPAETLRQTRTIKPRLFLLALAARRVCTQTQCKMWASKVISSGLTSNFRGIRVT